MTWSSSDASRQAAVTPGSDDQAAAAWDWKELRSAASGLGGTLQEVEEMEALRARELDAAYRRGLAEGEEAARERARQELASAVSAAMRVLEEVREHQAAWSARLHENLVTLGAGIARHIVEGELKQDDTIFRELTRKAISAFPADQPLKIRLHPDDMRAITGVVSDGTVASEVTGERDVRWLPDPDIIPGGCIVEGPDRIVDARVDEALERVYWSIVDG